MFSVRFHFLLWTVVTVSAKQLYRKIGDKAVLTPDSVVNLITSIEWKHGPDIAMEWYGDESFSYRQFKDRGSLNVSNGALTITGLTPYDSGFYTVEINNRVTGRIQLQVISPVSKPTVSKWCEPEMTYCVLTCNGNTTGAEPVTYNWTSDDKILSSTKQYNITKENEELCFRCVFENPVSSSSSEIIFNPFKEKQLYGKIGDKAVLTSDSVVNNITSIMWKHGSHIATEWFGDQTTAYQQFKGRGSLNTSNGALTIRGLTPGDSDIYTVEINNRVASKTELLVISPVPKPTISKWCDPETTYCVLTCNGDTTGAEPVTYNWRSDDKILSSTKEHRIKKEDEELWFRCVFENPVSSSSSETVFNPFKEKLYRKIGDKAVLTPDSVVNPITSIMWKQGGSIAMEWYGDETFSYRHFKGRGLLNISNGALMIRGLTPDDSGFYTVEINNRVNSKIELLVISPVPKPTVSKWCDLEMTYCVLTCNGNTTGAEPVTYNWTSDVTTWSSTKEHRITKENKELWFSCAFKNPVSSNSSEKVFNPFKESELSQQLIRNQKITFSLTLVFAVILVVCIIIIIIYSIYKHRKGKAEKDLQDFLQRFDKGDAAVRYWQEMKIELEENLRGRFNMTFIKRLQKGEPPEWALQEFLDRRDKLTSKMSEINKTSTQDLGSVVTPDTSNETETSPMNPDNAETRC